MNLPAKVVAILAGLRGGGKERQGQSGGGAAVIPLTEFRVGQEGEIAAIQTVDEEKLRKLMAMGLLPGNRIHLNQSFPSYIFRVGFSEFAIDGNLAREILVRR